MKSRLHVFVLGFLLLGTTACKDSSTNTTIPTTNYISPAISGYNMLPPSEFCFYVSKYPDIGDEVGYRILGHVESVLTEEESKEIRARNCAEDSWLCWDSAILRVRILEKLSAPDETGDYMYLVTTPLAEAEASKYFAKKDIVFFSPKRKKNPADFTFTTYYAVFVLDGGYAFATHPDSLSDDFGRAAVSDSSFMASVRRYVAQPSDCKWTPRVDKQETPVDETNTNTGDLPNADASEEVL